MYQGWYMDNHVFYHLLQIGLTLSFNKKNTDKKLYHKRNSLILVHLFRLPSIWHHIVESRFVVIFDIIYIYMKYLYVCHTDILQHMNIHDFYSNPRTWLVLYSRTPHWSYDPLVVGLIGSTTHWSYSALVFQTGAQLMQGHWIYKSLVLWPNSPSVRWSDKS